MGGVAFFFFFLKPVEYFFWNISSFIDTFLFYPLVSRDLLKVCHQREDSLCRHVGVRFIKKAPPLDSSFLRLTLIPPTFFHYGLKGSDFWRIKTGLVKVSHFWRRCSGETSAVPASPSDAFCCLPSLPCGQANPDVHHLSLSSIGLVTR